MSTIPPLTPQETGDTNTWRKRLRQALVSFSRFILHFIMGMLAAIFYALPWIIRCGAPALYIWLVLKTWPVLVNLYGTYTPALRHGLLAVVLSATLLPVIYTGARKPAWIWGAFYISDALLWGVWKWLPPIWPYYGLLFILAIPGAYTILTAVLITRIRLKIVNL